MPYHVYHLVDPETRQIRYIGKSTSPKSRHRQHIQESQERQNTEKKRWIAGLLARGLKPVLVIVASYPSEAEARTRESQDCHAHAASILNIHDPAKGAKDLKRVTRA